MSRRIPRATNAYTVDQLPPGTTREVIDITASDGAFSFGILHQPAPAARTCAMFMHPRTNQTRHYLSPWLIRAGIAVWGQASRFLNNDSDMTHEEVVLDAAAGMRLLRERGFDQIVLIGNSGGGSFLAFYQWQASTHPASRLAETPSGDPTGLATEEMPQADMYIALAAHAGEGRVLLNLLDASIVDELDPTRVDRTLDMFSTENGYRTPPEPSAYPSEFVDRYRDAQAARCGRLDALARSLIADKRESAGYVDPAICDTVAARRASLDRYMIVYGTGANPDQFDPTIAPSRRPGLAASRGESPLVGNLGAGRLGRVVTPRAWLSTWSGISSQAELEDSIEHLTVPTLIVHPDGDAFSSPAEQQDLLRRCGAEDKRLEVLEHAVHYLFPTPGAPADLPDPRAQAGATITEWIRARTPR